MSHILFIAYGGGHVTALAPVARRALDAGHDVRFLALTTARSVLANQGIPLLGFADLWDYAAPGARGYGEELARGAATGGPVSPAESTAYLGISFADLVVIHGEATARELLVTQGRQAFLPVAFFERVLAAQKPDIVVATNSPRSEQAALLACGRLGIPSICVIDLFALQEIKWCGQPGYASKICVLNPFVRDLFVAHGRRGDDIVVTGNPAFDRLTSTDARGKGAALKAARGWSDGLVNLLWASTVEPAIHPFNGMIGDVDLTRRVEEELRRFVRGNKGFRLIVRYHPSEQVRFVPETRVELSSAAEPVDALLHAVDIVVVTASTVGLEASLVGLPVISVDLSVFTPDTRYAELGVSTKVNCIDELPSALLALDRSGTVRASGLADAGPTDAVGRVYDVLISLIETER